MADILAMVVDSSVWKNLLKMPASEILLLIEKKDLRDLRPDGDDLLERRFDVDIEAEFLDWLEYCDISGDEIILEKAAKLMADGADVQEIGQGIWLLAEWASKGTWHCMEGRGFLYVEPYINRELDGISDFYLSSTWDDLFASMNQMNSSDYSEKVILDWMGRREKLGETMDEKQDPRILSTMQSHERLTNSLFRLSKLVTQKNLILLVRREFASYLVAGFGDYNIGTLLSNMAKGIQS